MTYSFHCKVADVVVVVEILFTYFQFSLSVFNGELC